MLMLRRSVDFQHTPLFVRWWCLLELTDVAPSDF